jgi:hypothetical protein
MALTHEKARVFFPGMPSQTNLAYCFFKNPVKKLYCKPMEVSVRHEEAKMASTNLHYI